MAAACSREGGSRRWRPFAPVRTPQCDGGAGQKEVSCVGQRAPARAARVVRGGVTRMGLVRVPPPREASSLLYENWCPAMDSCGVMGMFWGLGRCAHCAQTQLICGSAVLLLFCVCACVMRYIFISVLFSLGVRRVCVRCGYEDRIHFGRILEEL